jgi:hypothetical protein
MACLFVAAVAGASDYAVGALLGTTVFAGALIAAAPRDVLLMARRVADVWPAGTTVLIDIHPVRVFAPQAHTLPPPPVYNIWFTRLGRLVYSPEGGPGPLARIERRLQVGLARWSFLARNDEWVTDHLDARLKGGPDGLRSSSTTTWWPAAPRC